MDKKILIVTPWYPLINNGSFIHQQIKEISKIAEVYTLLIGHSKKIKRLSIKSSNSIHDDIEVKTMFFRFPYFYNILLILVTILGYLKLRKEGFDPDIVHAHTRIAGFACIPLKIIFKKKLFITEHSGRFTVCKEINQKLQSKTSYIDILTTKIAFKVADNVLPVSDSLKYGLESYGIKANYFVIPNLVVAYNFKKQISNNSLQNIVFVGSLNKQKGCEIAINAFAEIFNKLPQSATLTFIGDGNQKNELIGITKKKNLDNRIKFLGQLDHYQTLEIVSKSDFLLSCSQFESFGLMVAESIAVGTPVLVFDIPAFKEIVSPIGGILSPLNDINILKDNLVWMSNNFMKYSPSEMKSYINNKYGKKIFLNKIKEIYN